MKPQDLLPTASFLTILAVAVAVAVTAITYCQVPGSVPPTGTNAEIPELQSVPAKTNHPAPPKPAPEPPKSPAIVLRNVTIVYVKGQPVLCIPERYLADLTNIFKSVVLPKVILEEP